MVPRAFSALTRLGCFQVGVGGWFHGVFLPAAPPKGAKEESEEEAPETTQKNSNKKGKGKKSKKV